MIPDITGEAYRLAAWSMTGFGAILLLLQVLAREFGFALGRRRADNSAPEVGILVAAMMGLLAFVLALTLQFASSRFSERQDGTLAEANAIGTAWLRAKAIGHPAGQEIARLLEDYTRVRADFVRAPENHQVLENLSARTGALQNEIWAQMSRIAQERTDPIAESLMSALNQTFDMSTSIRFAFEKRLPPTLFWLLIGTTLVSMACLGFQLGLKATPLRVLGFLLALTWTAVIVDILDLAATRLGSIRTSAIAYEWTLSGFRPDSR